MKNLLASKYLKFLGITLIMVMSIALFSGVANASLDCFDDDDGDGYGDDPCNCNHPDAVDYGGDCDDTPVSGYPINPDTIWYKDVDGDDYSDGSTEGPQCSRPTNYYYAGELTATSGDCNDGEGTIYPGATEVADDSIDQNCNGYDLVTYYQDYDEDTYGNSAVSQQVDDEQPAGYVTDDTDCDDTDVLEHPGQTWYKDTDDDNYSTGETNTTSCTRPAGYKVASELTATSGDCNDGDDAINPGATENLTNCIDDDCNGYTDEITVDCNGSGYTTIQAGINAALSTGSSKRVVLVYPCTYEEGITFSGKDITVVSRDGAATTIISRPSLGNTVNFTSFETTNARLEGFTITHKTNDPVYLGAGIAVTNTDADEENPSTQTIKDCVITNNKGGQGISVIPGSTNPSSPTIEGCDITYNYTSYGAGIKTSTGCNITVTDCEISNNYAGNYGGGVYLSNSDVTFTNCQIINNRAEALGGGIYKSGYNYPYSTFTDCDISDNWVDSGAGGGISLHNGSTPGFINCNIARNHVSDCYYPLNGGGGIAANNWSHPRFINCNIVDNWTNTTYQGGDGGGVLLQSDSSGMFINCTISGNIAIDSGSNGNGIAMKYCTECEEPPCNGPYVCAYIEPPCDATGLSTVLVNSIIRDETYTYTSYCNIAEDSSCNGDPLFVDDDNEDKSLRDYHLTVNSPCIDAVSDPISGSGGYDDEDIDGDSRPIDGDCSTSSNEYDQGADEYDTTCP
jgi:hypothetical protein